MNIKDKINLYLDGTVLDSEHIELRDKRAEIIFTVIVLLVFSPFYILLLML